MDRERWLSCSSTRETSHIAQFAIWKEQSLGPGPQQQGSMEHTNRKKAASEEASVVGTGERSGRGRERSPACREE